MIPSVRGIKFLTAATTIALLSIWTLKGQAQKTLEEAPGPIYYRQVVEEVFQISCFDCHGSLKQKAGVRFDNYESALESLDAAIDMVELGDMPLGGPPLEQDKIDLLKAWRDQGAPKGDEEPPPPPPPPPLEPTYTSIRSRILLPNCIYCHSRDPQQDTEAKEHPFETYEDLFAEDDTIDRERPGKSKLLKKISKREMPPDPNPKLSPEEIAIIRKWIFDGAPNN